MNTLNDNNLEPLAPESLSKDFGRRWVEAMLATFDAEAAQLGELDRRAGDGDFGNNITAAYRRVRMEAARANPDDYNGWLTAVSRGFLGTGGTSGPLFGMFFRELARCATGDEPTMAELADGLAAGLATIQRYGKAEVGHKTMVDALAPATEAMKAALTTTTPPATDPLEAAAEAAVAGAQATAQITARRGRASYVGELSRGVLDAGAVAMALMLLSAKNAHAGTTEPGNTKWTAEPGSRG